MKVITVIELVDGLPIGVKSFIIRKKSDTDRVTKRAENRFKKVAVENGMNEGDLEIYLGAGSYSSGDYTVCISYNN